MSNTECKDDPVIGVLVGEEMLNCHHCGCSTEMEIEYDDGTRQERCTGCGQRYHVEDQMKIIYKVALWKTTVIEVEVDAEDADQARDLAMENFANGEYDERWSESETQRVEAICEEGDQEAGAAPAPKAPEVPEIRTADTNPDFGSF